MGFKRKSRSSRFRRRFHKSNQHGLICLKRRGALPKMLMLWWNGPSWITHSLERWPKQEISKEIQEKICMALGLMTCMEIISTTKATIIDVKDFRHYRINPYYLVCFEIYGKSEGIGSEILTQSEESLEVIEKWKLIRYKVGKMVSGEVLGDIGWSRSKIMNFPYFICRRRIAQLIVKQYHEKMLHASANLTSVKVH
ncbi:Uncharacterized protein ACO02O_11765 [Dirofilaria immitis]